MTITKSLNLTPDSLTLILRKPEGFSYKAGQHGNFVFSIGETKVERTYSFHTAPEIEHDLAITIRKVDGGTVSNHLVGYGVKAIELKGVVGEFIVEPSGDRKRHLVMFAGGSGITPILSMIKTILHKEHQSVISLIYSNQTFQKILFRTELDSLRNEYPGRLTVFHVLTREDIAPADFPVFYKGRMPRLVVKKLLKNLTAAHNFSTEYYLCGPFEFITTIEETIRAIHPDTTDVFKEHFFIPSNEPEFDFNGLAAREVTLQTVEGTKMVTVASGKSILQSALDDNLKLPYSCTEGQCGTCRTWLITGEVKMRRNHILTDEELKDGQILLCQGFPLSNGIVIKTRL